MSGPVIVAEWARNTRERVRVTLDRYQGHAVVSVRVWYDDGGTWKPGRDGLTLGTRHLPALADALARAREEAERRGMVKP